MSDVGIYLGALQTFEQKLSALHSYESQTSEFQALMDRQKQVFDWTRKHEGECIASHFQNAAKTEIRAEKIADYREEFIANLKQFLEYLSQGNGMQLSAD